LKRSHDADKMPEDITPSKGYFGTTYCLYLDQFAVSNLVEEQPGWKHVKQLIECGVANGQLVCPLPAEHFTETSGRHEVAAVKHHDYLVSLSGNFVFRPVAFIAAQLIISDIREINITWNTFLDRLDPAFSYKQAIEKFRLRHAEYKGMIQRATEASNALRDYTRTIKIAPPEQSSLATVNKSLVIGQFMDRLQELVGKGGLQIRGVKFETREVAHWIDYTLDVLLKKNKIKTAEAKKLLSNLKKNGFDYISPFDVRYNLQSYLAVQHKKQTVNDEIDIQRIAAAIQLADIMLVDRQRKFELEETRLARKYRTTVYCGIQRDLHSLEHMLDMLVA